MNTAVDAENPTKPKVKKMFSWSDDSPSIAGWVKQTACLMRTSRGPCAYLLRARELSRIWKSLSLSRLVCHHQLIFVRYCKQKKSPACVNEWTFTYEKAAGEAKSENFYGFYYWALPRCMKELKKFRRYTNWICLELCSCRESSWAVYLTSDLSTSGQQPSLQCEKCSPCVWRERFANNDLIQPVWQKQSNSMSDNVLEDNAKRATIIVCT